MYPEFIKLIIRKDAIAKSHNGMVSVNIRYTLNKKQERIPLPVKVLKEHWIEQKQRVNSNHPDSFNINKLLSLYATRATTYLSDCQIKKECFSKQKLKVSMFGLEPTDNFYDFMLSEIQNDNELKEYTKNNYITRMGKFKRFRENATIKEVAEYDFLTGYKNWCISIGNDISTYNKDLAIIKSFLNRAKKKELIEKHGFDKIKIQSGESKREYLSLEELHQLRDLYERCLLQPHLQRVLQLFLFVCYTGLRYQDLKALRYENIKGNILAIKMHKTQKIVQIPLMNGALALIPQHIVDTGIVFKVPSNQVFNRYLKDIIAAAGIKKQSPLIADGTHWQRYCWRIMPTSLLLVKYLDIPPHK
jgi:site-specific recombinase XerD